MGTAIVLWIIILLIVFAFGESGGQALTVALFLLMTIGNAVLFFL